MSTPATNTVAAGLPSSKISSSSGSSSTAAKSRLNSGVNLASLKIRQRAREQEEKTQLERKRGALVLVSRFLIDNGYLESAERLQHESGVSLRKYEIADNMDLESVVLEGFEDYYQMKFGKKPRLFRRATSSIEDSAGRTMNDLSGEKERPKRGASTGMKSSKRYHSNVEQSMRRVPPSNSSDGGRGALEEKCGDMTSTVRIGRLTLDVSGKGAPYRSSPETSETVDTTEEVDNHFENRLIKPIPDHLFFGEMRDLAEAIQREIIVENPQVRWDDIAGLESSKQLIKEAVVMPLRYPELFTGLLTPWKGVLLFGQPGTGKTMLAKAVATECNTTFFNISASSIVSKWRGDSEKLVRVLFELARHHAPTTIFMDELDSILGKRNSENEHEGSRRLKTELLIQMDGLAKTSDHIFFLAASNLPWDLDPAILRRLEKRIFVGLPDQRSRRTIFHNLLKDRGSGLDFEEMARRTEGYSGADIMLVCKESAMRQLRKVMRQLERFERFSNLEGVKMQNVAISDVTMADVIAALETTRPSGNVFGTRYEKWQADFGNTLTISVDHGDDGNCKDDESNEDDHDDEI